MDQRGSAAARLSLLTKRIARARIVAFGNGGSVVMVGTAAAVVKGGLCLAFLIVTAPTGSHALARAAHRSGTPLWKDSLLDQLADDREGGR